MRDGFRSQGEGRDSAITITTVTVIYITQHLRYKYRGKRAIITHPDTVSSRAFSCSKLSKVAFLEISLNLPYLLWLVVDSKPTSFMSFELSLVLISSFCLCKFIFYWSEYKHHKMNRPYGISRNSHRRTHLLISQLPPKIWKLSVEDTSKLKILENMVWILKIKP